MTGTPPAVPRFYSPKEAAGFFPGKTANWLKVQARKGGIPCTRMGRTIMFSDADLTDIGRMFQQKAQPQSLVARTPRRKLAAAARGEPALKAKVPPRKRSAA